MLLDLNAIREKPESAVSIKQKLMIVFLIAMLGGFLGFLAKYTDGSSIGLIGTYLSFWVLTTTIIAAWSRSPRAAAIHAFVFLGIMLVVYYLYSMVLFGFFPKSYFIGWGVVALLSHIGGYIVWYARGLGWMAAICAALPISLLLQEGQSFYYTFSLTSGIGILSAMLLFFILPPKGIQRLKVLFVVAVVTLIMNKIGLMYYFPW